MRHLIDRVAWSMVYGLWLVSLCLFEWMELGAKMAGKDIIGKDHCGDMAGREFGEGENIGGETSILTATYPYAIHINLRINPYPPP